MKVIFTRTDWLLGAFDAACQNNRGGLESEAVALVYSLRRWTQRLIAEHQLSPPSASAKLARPVYVSSCRNDAAHASSRTSGL